jgi:hypothetical protein
MPYKDFTVGQTLTSAEVDDYLMRQTVMVFDSASARSSALGTVVAEGMVSYLKDTDIVQQYNGTAWAPVGVDSFTTTGTAGNLLLSNGTAGVTWFANGQAGQAIISNGTAGPAYENRISPLLLLGV